MNTSSIQQFLRELDAINAPYKLASVREGSVMVTVATGGSRWEIEFFDDREPEIEVFRSDGSIFGVEKLTELMRELAD